MNRPEAEGVASRTQHHWKQHERVAHSLRICADRYRKIHSQGMPRADYEALREWFEAWHIELQRAYAQAVFNYHHGKTGSETS